MLFCYYHKEIFEKSNYYKQFLKVSERLERFKDSLFVETWEAELYFGDENSDFLVKEFREISSPKNSEKRATSLIRELIKGPEAKSVRTIPEQTKLNFIKIDQSGLVQIDFSDELSEFHPGGSSSEIITIFSVVNTLTKNIKEAKRVKFLINGKDIETIAGHIDCREPFSSNEKLVR